jgi:RNA-directed DNA polymerase
LADEGNLFVKTPKAAERVMGSVSRYIEKRLKRVVNRDKSQVARSDRVKFLGMTIVGATIAISHKALQAAMARVKERTPSGDSPDSGEDPRAAQQRVCGLGRLLCHDL